MNPAFLKIRHPESVQDGYGSPRVMQALRQRGLRHTRRAALPQRSGIQYACGDFRAALADAHLVASMSRKGNCYDNAAMVSFWSSFIRECANSIFPARREASAAAFDYFEIFYNRVRLHSALGFQPPADFENQLN